MVGRTSPTLGEAGGTSGASRYPQLYPDGSMIACSFFAPNRSIHACSFQARRDARAKQQVIQPKTRIAFPTTAHVVPERVNASIAIDHTHGIDPSLIDEPRISETALRMHERIIIP